MVALFMGFAALFGLSQINNAQGEQLSPDAAAVRAVVQKYCEADLRGANLSTDNYKKSGMDSFIVPGEHEPYGWDTVTVITKYKITNVEVLSGKASVKVQYDSLGELAADNFKADKQAETYTFKLIKKNEAWKLIDPYNLMPHIAIDTAINHLQSLYNEQKDAQRKLPEIIKKLRELKSSGG